MWRGYYWAVLHWENTNGKPSPSTTAESCHPDRWGWCKTSSNLLSILTLALKCTLFQTSGVILNNSFIIQLWVWEVLCNFCLWFSSRTSQKQRRRDLYCEDSGDSGRKCSEGECRGSRKCGVSFIRLIFKLHWRTISISHLQNKDLTCLHVTSQAIKRMFFLFHHHHLMIQTSLLTYFVAYYFTFLCVIGQKRLTRSSGSGKAHSLKEIPSWGRSLCLCVSTFTWL